jgi:tRNA-dihydrouridine synthase 4
MNNKVTDLLSDPSNYTKISAPMVRYSRLPFRITVLNHGCQIAYTPMIIAQEFIASPIARDCDFQMLCQQDDYPPRDRPVIVQFAASNPSYFAKAAQLVSRFADGADLNCGCPQRWAIQEGIGSALLAEPQKIFEMVRETFNCIDKAFPVSVKIRLQPKKEASGEVDVSASVETARQIESAGASWITIHARTAIQRSATTEPNWAAFREVVQSLKVPVVANGSIFFLADADEIHCQTGCSGVMAARGLLANPGMFAGDSQTTNQVIREFVENSCNYGSVASVFHQHLIYMLEGRLNASDRRLFATCVGVASILDFLREREML